MRDSIMHMKKVQVLVPDNIHQLAGKGRVVGRVFEQRIIVGVYLVVKHVFLKRGQPGRALIRDKMNLMPRLARPIPSSVATTPLPP